MSSFMCFLLPRLSCCATKSKLLCTKSLVIHSALVSLSDCQPVWLLYNVITPPPSPHPPTTVRLPSVITTPPPASEFELEVVGLGGLGGGGCLLFCNQQQQQQHVIVIINKFANVHVKYRMFC